MQHHNGNDAADPAHPLPPLARRRSLLIAVPSIGPRWPGGLRAAAAFGVPALVLLALGFQTEALLTATGGFAVVYGEGRPFRSRWSVVLLAGLALVASATVGGVIGEFLEPGTRPVGAVAVVIALSLVGAVAAFVVDALRLGPPGAFFFVLTCAISTVVPQGGISALVNSGCVAIGAAWALVVSMSPALLDRTKPQSDAVAAAERAVGDFRARSDAGTPSAALRHQAAVRLNSAWSAVHGARIPARRMDDPLVVRLRTAHLSFAGVGAADVDPRHATDIDHAQIPMAGPTIGYRLRRALHPSSHASTTASRVLASSLVAGAVSVALGLGRPDWAVVSTVLILQQGLDRRRGAVRGVHRLAGTVVGVVAFAIIFSLSLSGFALVLVLMALQFVIELYIARNYGIAVAFITPLALLIGGASHPGAQAWTLAGERLLETAIGVLCAFAAMWVVAPRSYRRCLRWCDRRVVESSIRLLDDMTDVSPSATTAMALRRDVQFELVGAALAAEHAANDDREWTASHWSRHTDVDTFGYDLLAACWSVPARGRLSDHSGWTSRAYAMLGAESTGDGVG